MKILISIGTLGLGGAEKQAVWLANRLSEIHDVTLLTFYGGPREVELSKSVTWKRIFEDLTRHVSEKDPKTSEGKNQQSSDHINSSTSKIRQFKRRLYLSASNLPKSVKKIASVLISLIRVTHNSVLQLSNACNFVFRASLRWITLKPLTTRFAYHFSTYKSVKALLNEAKPETVITFLFHDTLSIGICTLFMYPRPRLIVGRRSPIGYGGQDRSRMQNLVIRLVYYFADVAVTNSRANVSSAVEDGIRQSKMRVIHNFVNSNNTSLVSNPANDIHLICIANFFEYKNHENLVRALSQIETEIRITFLGEGPLRSKIEFLAEDCNLNATFVDHNEQLEQSFWSVDYLVLPSVYEGSSNALLEALASGIPAIVTNVGLAEELSTMGAPVIVSRGTDVDSLREAVSEGLLTKDANKLKAVGFKKKIELEFNEEKILAEWLNTINSIK